jgi:hypothetical protein
MNAAIPTSQRPEMCNYVANSLTDYENVFVFVNNSDFSDYEKLKWNDNVRLFWLSISGEPKQCHNKTFLQMLTFLPVEDTLFIEDDVTLSDLFINEFQAIFKLFSNGWDISLSPIWIPEKKCHYTPDVSQDSLLLLEFGEHLNFKRQRYIDGNFAIKANILKHFKSIIGTTKFPVLKSNSGISPVLSKEMYKMGFPMWVIIPSLLGHGDHESLQFPEGRKRVPLIAKI